MQTLLWIGLPITSREIAQRYHWLTEISINLVHYMLVHYMRMLSAAPSRHRLIPLREIMNDFAPCQEVYY